MNVCAFLGGKTTEHESFSAQRNARQGAKHRKKEGECHFLDCCQKSENNNNSPRRAHIVGGNTIALNTKILTEMMMVD